MRLIAEAILFLPILVIWVPYRIGLVKFTTVSQFLAVFPGLPGRWWRRFWYRMTLDRCGRDIDVDWMAAIKTTRTRVGNNVYIGPFCWIGWADIGDDVMLGGHVTLLSGGHHHRFERVDVPMSHQGGEYSRIAIGRDVWIGNGAVVFSSVETGSVVGAGAVVTKTFEAYSVLAGVPARPLRRRVPRDDER